MPRKPSVLVATAVAAALLSACGNADIGTVALDPDQTSTRPTESLDLSVVPGTAKSNKAEDGTGDWVNREGGPTKSEREEKARKWTEVRAARVDRLGRVVVNGSGLTLYRFDDDEASPSKSVCNGPCAETWPPVVVREGETVYRAYVSEDALGTVRRDDGELQLTIGGWPVYRFADDRRFGDTRGQGLQGKWFAVKRDGGKAVGADSGAEPTAPASPGSTGKRATSVTFFEDADFAESGMSFGVSGPGCQNLPFAGVASALTTDGTVRMWAGKDCKGELRVVDGDVPDLSVINFDDTVASVRLA
ncbi:hypothetical protein [Asanoa siamensis]|uniref:Lipoprotein with Yx(FWY)xxD motif n=1 Tax=Asanoa siamensis TaxID=926357 RepID=A0ABQ4D2J0_9ACTN|nr:hypothetical protein [Asanoa siamensis]GIF77724.1 hypothetical protein Asi02nite_72420 [Asanoa siamensis]